MPMNKGNATNYMGFINRFHDMVVVLDQKLMTVVRFGYKKPPAPLVRW